MHEISASANASSTTPPIADTVAQRQAPDWESLDCEIHCPLCGYNLRGLSCAKCPECGSQHSWDDLLDPRRREHPYLFEHHPERNAWSFRRTLLGGMRPQAFWTTLHPMQRVSRRRLGLYALAIVVMSYCLFAFSVLGYYLKGNVGQIYWDYQNWQWMNVVMSTKYSLARLEWRLAFLMPMFWAILSALSLLLFLPSMRRAGMRSIHVVRVVVYASDVIVLLWLANSGVHWIGAVAVWLHYVLRIWLGPVALLWVIVAAVWLYCREFPATLGWRRVTRAGASLAAIVVFAALVYLLEAFIHDRMIPITRLGDGPICTPLMVLAGFVFAKRLAAACEFYLGLGRGRTIAWLSQIVTFLAVCCAISIFEVYRRGGFG